MYINYDSNYNESVLSDSRKWNVYRISRFVDGYWNTISDADNYLKSFNFSDNSSDGSNITMGYVCGCKAVLEFKNAPTSLVNTFTEGTQILVYMSLKGKETDAYASQINTVPLVIDEVKVVPIMNGRNITVTAYDLSYLMTHEYVSAHENPTALEIVTEIATKYGLTVDSSVSAKIAELGSSLSSVRFKPLSGFTCKQTLGFIAGCFGCNARVGLGRKIYFEWYETSPMPDIGKDIVYLGGSTLSEGFTVKLIETGTSENPIVYPNNTSGYSINFENPYITADLARLIYDNKIANNKISFRSGKVKYKGNPINTSGKIVTTSDVDDASVKFYIMKRTLNYDGGLSETIECFGESETTINYKINSPTQQRINRALSKMEDAIKAATDVITQTKGSIFELIPVDENDATKGNAGFKIHYEDTGSSAFDDCVIMGTAGGVGLSTNNGETFATAMYFYQDEAGEIHGAINGEVIRAGSISADKIDTSQLIVSKGNVEGLDAELAELLEVANEADKKAGNAQTTANSAKNALVDLCTNNKMTLIDGAKIYTGSIAANSIDVNTLSVGTGVTLNQFYNDEFYDGTKGWYAYNGTLKAQGTNQSWAYMQLNPTNAEKQSVIMQKVWLVNGQRYAIAAQVCPLDWEKSRSDVSIHYFIGEGWSSAGLGLKDVYNPKNLETVVKIVFDYSGNTGFVDLGIAFRGILTSSSTPCTINIAWMSFGDATGETPGFYCTRKEWLASGYKDSNYLGGSVNNNTTADAYLTKKALSIDAGGNLVTLGTIKSDNGEIGSMTYNPDRMDMTTHSYYLLSGEGYFNTSRISFVNPPVYTDSVSSNGINTAEDLKEVSPYIEVVSVLEKDGKSAESYTAITPDGVSVSLTPMFGSGGNSALTAFGVEVDGVLVTSRESSKKKIAEKSKVLSAFKSSKIYEYKMKYDDDNARAKTGFVIERETPEEVLSDDGKHINLYSMASINWKATQEILERLEALEQKAVNNNVEQT